MIDDQMSQRQAMAALLWDHFDLVNLGELQTLDDQGNGLLGFRLDFLTGEPHAFLQCFSDSPGW